MLVAPQRAPFAQITAVLLPPDVRGQWGTICARHNHVEAWPSRTMALIAVQHVADWCLICGTAGVPSWCCPPQKGATA